MKILCDYLAIIVFITTAASSLVMAQPLPHTEVPVHLLNQDLPQKGRSLFDELLASYHQKKDRDFELPFPYEALIGSLQEVANQRSLFKFDVASVAFPIGRSLQKPFGYPPNPFRYPRWLTTFRQQVNDQDRYIGSKVFGRLFTGFHAPSNQVEVISYNELAGRYEFQVIKDYKESGTKQLYYVKRAFCLQCHQGQSPIFSVNPWSESSGNALVALLMEGSLPEDQKEIPLYRNALQRGLTFAQSFDASAHQGQTGLVMQKLWENACSLAENDYLDCRAHFLKAVMAQLIFTRIEASWYREPALARWFPQAKLTQLKKLHASFPSSRISDRLVISEDEVEKLRDLFPEKSEWIDRLHDLAQRSMINYQVLEEESELAKAIQWFLSTEDVFRVAIRSIYQLTADQDPQTARRSDDIIRASDRDEYLRRFAYHFSSSIFKATDGLSLNRWLTSSQKDMSYVAQAIEELASTAKSDPEHYLRQPHLSRRQFLGDLIKRMDAPLESYTPPTLARFYAPLQELDLNEIPDENAFPNQPQLNTFVHYCGLCHTTQRPMAPPFLDLDSAEESHSLMKLKRDRFLYYLQTPVPQMPPPDIVPRLNQKLIANPQHRRQMIEYIEMLTK